VNSSAAHATREISVEEFLRQLSFATGQDNVLGACYHAEILSKEADFGTGEIQTLLNEAKLPNISNLSRDLRSLAASSMSR
jgi:hypothetical protein